MEVSAGRGGGHAAGVAADCAWLLLAGCHGPQSPLGAWYTRWAGHSLAFTFEGLVVGSVIYSLPFAVQPIAASF
jgi:ABC-type molybdate transport system permease subunit